MRVALLMLNWFIPYPSHFLETCSVVMFHYFLQKKSMSDRDSQAESSYDTDSNHSVGRESDAGSESLRDFIAEGDDHSVASEESVDFDRLTKEERQEYERRMHERAAREEDEFIHESSKNIVEGKRRNRGKKRTTADEVEDLETQLDELKRDLEEVLDEIRDVKSSKPIDRGLLEDLEEARDIYSDRIEIAKEKLETMKEKEVLVMGDYDRWHEELAEVEERKLPALENELDEIQNALDTRDLNTSEKAVLQKRSTTLKRKRTTLEKTKKRLKSDIQDYDEFQRELEQETSGSEHGDSDSDFGPGESDSDYESEE